MSHTVLHKFPKTETPYPLSRHIEHDSRSRSFTYEATGPVVEKTIIWPHNTPVLNQGQVGSCTGNAMTQLLNCAKFAPCREGKISLDEADALKLYSLATHFDGFGANQYYPPNDDGSSGLGVAKAAIFLKYIESYQHCFTYPQLQAAIQTQPVITGTSWTNSMFNPDAQTGIITVGPLNDQTVAGGHEYLIQGLEYQLELADLPVDDYIVMLNSWGTGWGGGQGLKPGQARIRVSEYINLLADQGDIVVPTSSKAL
jgi:hypothetical protein